MILEKDQQNNRLKSSNNQMNIQDQEDLEYSSERRKEPEIKVVAHPTHPTEEDRKSIAGTVETGELLDIVIAPFDRGTPR